MAKTKKPRKRYRGADAAIRPKVIKIEAKKRSALGEWWHDHKSNLIPKAILLALLLLLGFLVYWVVSLLF